MPLQTKIVEDWKLALKNKDPKKDVLSMIINELKNRAIKEGVLGEKGRVVSNDVAIEVLRKMAKQRKEAIQAYQAANRSDLVEKEGRELSVVESYLPKPLDDEELKAIVTKVIHDLNATSMKDLGSVMSASMKLAQGKADGKQIQAMVLSLLKSKEE
jgi:uncharacterized protein